MIYVCKELYIMKNNKKESNEKKKAKKALKSLMKKTTIKIKKVS